MTDTPTKKDAYRFAAKASAESPVPAMGSGGSDHTSEARGNEMTNLTALETPFGLLPEPVQEALKAWPYGVESFQSVWRVVSPLWSPGTTYRAKPTPIEVRVECYRGAMGDHRPQEHGTCIKRADGTIDWTTWEPQP